MQTLTSLITAYCPKTVKPLTEIQKSAEIACSATYENFKVARDNSTDPEPENDAVVIAAYEIYRAADKFRSALYSDDDFAPRQIVDLPIMPDVTPLPDSLFE